MSAHLIDLEAFRATSLSRDPFPYLIVPHFVRPEQFPAIEADYPRIDQAGSFPLGAAPSGPAFKSLMTELEGPEFRLAIEEKFSLDLASRPTMITVRGRTDATDGRIHTDSKSKLITVLIYFNGKWETPKGRLRLLRSPSNLNDMAVEVPPDEGTLLAFHNQPNAWHGHEPFEGPRRAIQLNWVRDRAVVRREHLRHTISAFFKKLKKAP